MGSKGVVLVPPPCSVWLGEPRRSMLSVSVLCSVIGWYPPQEECVLMLSLQQTLKEGTAGDVG